MKKPPLVLALAISAISFATMADAANADVANDLKQLAEKSPYYSGKLADKKAPKGAMISDAMHKSIIDPEAKQGSYAFDKVTHDPVAPGVHSFNLGTIVNSHIIETKNGIVVYDTGDNLEEGLHFYSEIRKVTDKPIKAIMYSHEHYTGGSQAMVDEEAKRGNTDIKIIGHWNLMNSLAESGAGAALHKEVSDALAPRVIQQFYTLTPESGSDAAGHTHTIDVTGEKKIAPVNTPITKDGQKITIDGRKFVFYIDDITTDTAQQLMVSIPDQGIVLHNIVWGFFPNIYSIRGGEYRNPAVWIKALDKLESLNPKILLGTHIKSTADHDEAMSRIQTYQDAISSILNQTLFEMIKGVQREKAAYEVELPSQIINQPHVRQNYGEVVTMVPQIYSAVLGSFNGVAADAVPMHPSAEADMIVRGMGGQKAALKFAEGEFLKGNFLNAVRLGKHLVNYDSKNQANIDFQIKALRAMAGATESHNLRSWYLSQAIILNGDAALPGAFPVAPEIMACDKYQDRRLCDSVAPAIARSALI